MNGRIKQQFINIIEYDNEYYYNINLTSEQFSSLFPNIVINNNYKVYYIKNDILKIITFTKGSYEVTNINSNFQLKLPN